MIELPEARIIARDLKNEILGKTIVDVRGNFTDHKFTYYSEDPNKYKEYLINKKITSINERNFYVEIEVEDYKIIFRDGANIRYYDNRQDYPENSKFFLEFNDGSFINVTTSMYCCIAVFDKVKGIDNMYYNFEFERIGAYDKEFTLSYFNSLINDKTKKLSLKAFLATEQRILGVGNGIVQDMLFNARMSPRRKLVTLSESEIEILYNSVIGTIKKMISENGRNTEKTIYNEFGNYKTIMSSKNFNNGCPLCNGTIKKEQYLGGSVYYCPNCQK